MSKEQLESLKYYKEDGYREINDFLRDIRNTDTMLKSLPDGKYKKYEKIKKHISNIDSLFKNENYKYNDKKILYRGFSPYYGKETKTDEYGYGSTTKNIDVALSFTSQNCCILEFYLPENVKGIDMSKTNISNDSYEEDYEEEVLLERNIQFTNIKKIGIKSSGAKNVEIYAATVQKIVQLSNNDLYNYKMLIKEEKERLEKERLEKERLEKERFEKEKQKKLKQLIEDEEDPFLSDDDE